MFIFSNINPKVKPPLKEWGEKVEGTYSCASTTFSLLNHAITRFDGPSSFVRSRNLAEKTSQKIVYCIILMALFWRHATCSILEFLNSQFSNEPLLH